MRYLLGDKGYDRRQGLTPPGSRSLREAEPSRHPRPAQPQARPSATTRSATADRHLIENAFCRLKNFRRVATRYDKLAANFLSGVALATAIAL